MSLIQYGAQQSQTIILNYRPITMRKGILMMKLIIERLTSRTIAINYKMSIFVHYNCLLFQYPSSIAIDNMQSIIMLTMKHDY